MRNTRCNVEQAWASSDCTAMWHIRSLDAGNVVRVIAGWCASTVSHYGTQCNMLCSPLICYYPAFCLGIYDVLRHCVRYSMMCERCRVYLEQTYRTPSTDLALLPSLGLARIRCLRWLLWVGVPSFVLSSTLAGITCICALVKFEIRTLIHVKLSSVSDTPSSCISR